MGIAQWQAGEGPRDKLLERGERALSDAELLAVMLRTGYRNCSALQLARDLLEQFGAVEQGLRRNAADVEAGAAERLAALDAGGLEAELCSADRGDIAAGSGADDKHVVVVVLVSHCQLRSP